MYMTRRIGIHFGLIVTFWRTYLILVLFFNNLTEQPNHLISILLPYKVYELPLNGWPFSSFLVLQGHVTNLLDKSSVLVFVRIFTNVRLVREEEDKIQGVGGTGKLIMLERILSYL